MITLLTGNGRILLAVDEGGNWAYLYYPYAGQFQHLKQNSLGLYDVQAGRFAWLGGQGFQVHQAHEEGSNVGLTEHEGWGLKVAVEDMIHPDMDVLIRSIAVENRGQEARSLRLFSYHCLNIAESMYQDTCYWDEPAGGVVHYKRNFYFMFRGLPRLTGFSCGEHTLKGLQGSYVDAEDGHLEGSPVSHGAADSVVQWDLSVGPGQTGRVALLLLIARSRRELKELDRAWRDQSVEARVLETKAFWRSWVEEKEVFAPQDLSPLARDLYLRSIFVLRNCNSANGSIIASPDFASLRSGGDTYNYNWWRDGSYSAMAMDDVGLKEGAQRFLEFARQCQEDEGFWLHRHFPEGSVGSTWHQPPFLQVDQTAAVIAATWHHFARHGDMDHLLELWPMVKRATNFLVDFVDAETGLVAPSYDLWEERRSIHTYSCAAVHDALTKAELIGHRLGKGNGAWGQRAAALRTAILDHLWDAQRGVFLRSLKARDAAIDASTLLTLRLGVLEPPDPRARGLVENVTRALWSPRVGGIGRYQGDRYCGNQNPWIICTLWLAEARLLLGDLPGARELLEWVARAATPTLLLPEQLNSTSGVPSSVVPLVWSHATFVEVVNKYRHHAFGLAAEAMESEISEGHPMAVGR